MRVRVLWSSGRSLAPNASDAGQLSACSNSKMKNKRQREKVPKCTGYVPGSSPNATAQTPTRTYKQKIEKYELNMPSNGAEWAIGKKKTCSALSNRKRYSAWSF